MLVVADVDLGLGLAGDHGLGARDVGDLVEHRPAGAVGGARGILRVAWSGPRSMTCCTVWAYASTSSPRSLGAGGCRDMRPQYLRWWSWPSPADPVGRERSGARASPRPRRARGPAGGGRRRALTGALAPLELADPGPLVRWGVPLVSSVSTLASAATVGLLGLAAFLAPERTHTAASGHRHPVCRHGRHRVGARRAARGGADLRRPRGHPADQRRACSTSSCRSPGPSRRRGCCSSAPSSPSWSRCRPGWRPAARRWPGWPCSPWWRSSSSRSPGTRRAPRATRTPSTRSACTCSASSSGPGASSRSS